MPDDRHVAPVLRMLNGPSPGRSYELRDEVTVLGRHKDCQIVLPAGTVSKRHAEIRHTGSGFVLKDLGSRNKTLINGAPIAAPTRLRHGDRLSICTFSFVFHHPLVTIREDDQGNSTILGTIEVSGSSSHVPKVRPEDTLKAILEISRDIGNSLHFREVLDRTLDSLFKIFPQADRGVVLLAEGEGGGLVPQAVRYRREDHGPLDLSTTVSALVLNEGKAILSTNVSDDWRFQKSPSLQGTAIRTMMCVPLMGPQRKPIGLIQIDTRDLRSRFSQENLDLLAAIAGPVSLAVENARLHEDLVRLSVIEASLRSAHEVQVAFLPEQRPDLPGYAFWDAYVPALSVGGDYFDYLELGDADGASRLWAVTIGDVSGKGMPAALMVAKLSAEVRACLLSEPDPVRALGRLNRQLYDERFPERFITFLLVLLDGETNRMTIVNAGHMAPVIRRASGPIEVLGQEEGGPPLAILEDACYQAVQTTLEPGDDVVLYTDGINEAMDPRDQTFKNDRLLRAILRAPADPEGLGEAILRAVKRHAAGCPQSDDIGLVCFRRVGSLST